jgi:hypothetical protein
VPSVAVRSMATVHAAGSAGPAGLALMNDLPQSLSHDITQWLYMRAIQKVCRAFMFRLLLLLPLLLKWPCH